MGNLLFKILVLKKKQPMSPNLKEKQPMLPSIKDKENIENFLYIDKKMSEPELGSYAP